MRTNPLLHADGTLNVQAVLAMHHAKFGALRMEGDGGGGAGDGGSGDGDGGGNNSGGDQNTYSPPATQADFDARVQDRVRRAQQKGFQDAEAKYKPGHDQHAALEAELGTAADKAAKKARDEEREKANSEFIPRVVKAEFKAAAKGVLSDEQLTALLEDLDLSKYVTSTGDVDEDKVSKKVTAFAPAVDGKGAGGNNTRTPNLGQGNHQQSQAKPGDAGRAMAEKRFKKTGS
jgi:hypothetical protein